MPLYSLRTALYDYRITKFDRDLNVESSYLISSTPPHECECPAGTRSTCRHRQMLPNLLPLLDTEYFWDFERNATVDANGTLKASIDLAANPELLEPREPTPALVELMLSPLAPHLALTPNPWSITMKRYLVFACESYYPGGGWGDFQKSFNERQEAIDYADSINHKWSGGVEVVDLETEQDIYIYPQYREVVS